MKTNVIHYLPCCGEKCCPGNYYNLGRKIPGVVVCSSCKTIYRVRSRGKGDFLTHLSDAELLELFCSTPFYPLVWAFVIGVTTCTQTLIERN